MKYIMVLYIATQQLCGVAQPSPSIKGTLSWNITHVALQGSSSTLFLSISLSRTPEKICDMNFTLANVH